MEKDVDIISDLKDMFKWIIYDDGVALIESQNIDEIEKLDEG